MKIWWFKRWRARAAGKGDALGAIGLLRGEQPAPFVQDVVAQWDEERNRMIAGFYEGRQQQITRPINVPVIVGADDGLETRDERRRAFWRAGAEERTRLEDETFYHELRLRWSRYARVITSYVGAFYRHYAAGADIDEALFVVEGVGERIDDHTGQQMIPDHMAHPREAAAAPSMGFAPALKANDKKFTEEVNEHA